MCGRIVDCPGKAIKYPWKDVNNSVKTPCKGAYK
jgi:hypothetical protein